MTLAVTRHARRRAQERLCARLTDEQWRDIIRQIESGKARRGPRHSSLMNAFEVDVVMESGSMRTWVVVENGAIVTILTPSCADDGRTGHGRAHRRTHGSARRDRSHSRQHEGPPENARSGTRLENDQFGLIRAGSVQPCRKRVVLRHGRGPKRRSALAAGGTERR